MRYKWVNIPDLDLLCCFDDADFGSFEGIVVGAAMSVFRAGTAKPVFLEGPASVDEDIKVYEYKVTRKQAQERN